MASGIYVIKNFRTGDVYVGSSNNVERRWQTHRSALDQGKHDNKALQNAWHQWTSAAFVFEILEEVDNPHMLLVREDVYISRLRPAYNGKPGVKRIPVAPSRELHIKIPLTVYEAVDHAAGFDPISTYIVRVLRKELGLTEEQQQEM